MKLRNFFFVKNDDCQKWVVPGDKVQVSVAGFLSEADGYAYVQSPAIQKIDDKLAVTESGETFELEDINPDYKDYLDAIKGNIPIVRLWHLEGQRGTYYLTGILPQKIVRDQIIEQNGNFLYLKNEGRVYVHWREYGVFFLKDIMSCGKVCDLEYPKDFQMYGDFICRPIIFK